MPRPPIYTCLSRAQLKLESKLHRAAKKKAAKLRLKGGFNEYVTDLLTRDLAKHGVTKSERQFCREGL